MDPVTTITTALTSVQTAAEIVKLLRNVDLSLEKAELKAKLVDMAEVLVTARQQILDIRQLVADKDEVIATLQKALELRGKLIPKDSTYWLTDEDGNTTDGPFCTRCYEVDKALRRLVAGEREPRVECPCCKSVCSSQSAYYRLRPGVVEAIKKINESLQDQTKPRLYTDLF